MYKNVCYVAWRCESDVTDSLRLLSWFTLGVWSTIYAFKGIVQTFWKIGLFVLLQRVGGDKLKYSHAFLTYYTMMLLLLFLHTILWCCCFFYILYYDVLLYYNFFDIQYCFFNIIYYDLLSLFLHYTMNYLTYHITTLTYYNIFFYILYCFFDIQYYDVFDIL